MEAGHTEQELREAFARIEVAVEGGNTDLAALGFWRRVAQVKRDPTLVVRWAEQIGRIDRAAFEAAVSPRFPVWFGNLVMLAEVAFGTGAIALAAVSSGTVTGLGLIAGGVAWAISFHCLAHWVVGRMVGIRFTAYFLGGPFPRRPGLKIDYESYLRASAMGRAVMHGSGAVATKLAPFLALSAAPAYEAPGWSVIVLLVIGFGQIVTDVLFSVKTGDWKKVRRELAVARALRTARDA